MWRLPLKVTCRQWTGWWLVGRTEWCSSRVDRVTAERSRVLLWVCCVRTLSSCACAGVAGDGEVMARLLQSNMLYWMMLSRVDRVCCYECVVCGYCQAVLVLEWLVTVKWWLDYSSPTCSSSPSTLVDNLTVYKSVALSNRSSFRQYHVHTSCYLSQYLSQTCSSLSMSAFASV